MCTPEFGEHLCRVLRKSQDVTVFLGGPRASLALGRAGHVTWGSRFCPVFWKGQSSNQCWVSQAYIFLSLP